MFSGSLTVTANRLGKANLGRLMSGISRLLASMVVLLLCTEASLAADGEMYRWVDDEGVVHFSDSIPPQYSKLNREVLNQHGVTVDVLAGEKTEQELIEEQQLAALKEAEQKQLEEAAQRDRILLTTYLSVDEIERLRDRRVELMEGQIRVTEIYLTNLRAKLVKLQREAEPYRPYNIDPDAPPINERLARELSDTLDSIILYEKNLAGARTQQLASVAKFAADIERFQALKDNNWSNN